MKYGTNLISGEVFCVFIFFHFSHSGLSVLNGLNFFYSRWRDGENREQSISGMSLNCPEMRNEYGKSENEIWEQNRELEMKLLIGLGFKLGYFPFFISRSLFPVPRSSFLPGILFVSSRRRVAWRAERLFVFASHANRRKQLKFSNCHIAGFKYCVVATMIQRPSKRPLILYKRVDWMYQISFKKFDRFYTWTS